MVAAHNVASSLAGIVYGYHASWHALVPWSMDKSLQRRSYGAGPARPGVAKGRVPFRGGGGLPAWRQGREGPGCAAADFIGFSI